MARLGRPGLSPQQKAELWTRWKAGQSLSDIGRALGEHAASVFGVLLAKGGIAPLARKRSSRSLSLQDREEISRGLIAGLSLRKIAEQLGRSPSTISRKVERNRGRYKYRATVRGVLKKELISHLRSRRIMRRGKTSPRKDSHAGKSLTQCPSVSAPPKLMTARYQSTGKATALRRQQHAHCDPGRAPFPICAFGSGQRQRHRQCRVCLGQAGQETTGGTHVISDLG